MRELIVLGVGSCGINLSSSYLSLLTQEHGFSAYSSHISPHFHEASNSNVARFLFIDNDPFPIDNLLSHPDASLISQDNLLAGHGSSMNLFPKAKSDDDLFQLIIDSLRKEFEKCDSVQGVIINHSTIGGTGSGLSNRIMKYLFDNKQGGLLINNIIVPTTMSNMSEENFFEANSVLSYYNFVLSIKGIIEFSNLSILSDNYALFKLIDDVRTEKYNQFSWNSMNKILMKSISAITSGSRFEGIQPCSLRKIMTNCIPFPRLHLFVSNYLEDCYNRINFMESCKENVKEQNSSMLTFNRVFNSTFSSFALFRGTDYSSSDLEEFNRSPLVNVYDFIPAGLVGHVNKSIEYVKEGGIFHQGEFIGRYMHNLTNCFAPPFYKKAFLHWYLENGSEQMEFNEGESELYDLFSEYVFMSPYNDEIGEYDETDV